MSSEHVGPAVVGGLIVRNGRHRGTRVPLKLPVTVIGSDDHCDVRIRGEGITNWHCVIAVTPAGPTVRSWHAETTLVNGHPTTAAVLAHGDELTVGPCSFRLAWFGEINTAEPDESTNTAAIAVADTPEWSIHEREQSLHEQEKQLSALLEHKQQNIDQLLSQLSENREQFLVERDGVKGELAAAKKARRDAESLRKTAEATRQKNHATYRKLVLRAKRQRLDGERTNAAAARVLDEQRRQFEREKSQFEMATTRMTTDATTVKQRMNEAWDLLETGNRRLLGDRQQFECQIAEQRSTLDQYAAELEQRDRTITHAHAKLEARCADLQAELIGLDRRATHAQIAVQDLEWQRTKLEAAGIPTTTVPISQDLVPLNARRDRSFDELMADLTGRERELDRELKTVAVQKGEFERLAGELADQRAMLLAQFNKLAAAARLWQQEECGNASELERLASDLESRERVVIVREQRLLVAEDQCRQRERDLWAFRVKLEGWQAGLTAHESQWYAHRDQIDTESDRQRERLAQWEASLEHVCATWQTLRSKERESLLAELDGWRSTRAEYVTARDELDVERTAFARQATLLAARMIATEEAAAAVDTKRLRLLQKKWESHFRRFEKLWESRQQSTVKLAKSLDEKMALLKSETAKFLEQKNARLAKVQDRDRAELTAKRHTHDQLAKSARPRRIDRELSELRSEVERISAVLMNAPMPTGEQADVPLMLARAA